MKGEEESFQIIIFLIGSIAFILLLISLVTTFVDSDYRDEYEIKGDKFEVIVELREFIYDCWSDHKGSYKNAVCFKIFMNSSETITEEDILKHIDESKIKKEYIEIEEIEKQSYVIIKYDEEKIVVESRYYNE
ncbi:MAG: hypothetical protein KAU95_04215 [Candidatus Aenigmarchaeota archaeon]|nr:hypothetical protein [Candidatus Aenigmarchaeota archaeon]